MISSNDIKRGQTIVYNDAIWRVIEFQHVKPGKGQAFVRSKLKNLRTGARQDITFKAAEKLEPAHIDMNTMQYLYEADDLHMFMDIETYEQIGIPTVQIEDELKFLKDGMEVDVQRYKGEVLGVQLPSKVKLAVIETEPGLRGDTQSGGSKTAKLETGTVITVPLFINVGDILEVNTEEGSYSSRA